MFVVPSASSSLVCPKAYAWMTVDTKEASPILEPDLNPELAVGGSQVPHLVVYEVELRKIAGLMEYVRLNLNKVALFVVAGRIRGNEHRIVMAVRVGRRGQCYNQR